MDIAKQIATNQEELVKTPPKITATDIRKDRRSSVPTISGKKSKIVKIEVLSFGNLIWTTLQKSD